MGNFSFEQAREPGQNPTLQVQRLEAELAVVWMAVACDGDEILTPQPIPDPFWRRMEKCFGIRVHPMAPHQLSQSRARTLVPWGWTPAVRTQARKLGIEITAPEQDLIWSINAREFAFQLCEERGLLLPGEGMARTFEEAQQLLQGLIRTKTGWVIKPNQSQSGRGQMRGTSVLTDRQMQTVRRLIERQGCVHIEPLLNGQKELSGQWDIPPSGSPQFLGLTELRTDSRGRYAGTGIKTLGLSVSLESALLRDQSAAVARLQSLGYFGPVGIDAMLFKSENQECIRSIQDLNARWTMGRIGWEWGMRLSARLDKRNKGNEISAGFWNHSPVPLTADSIPLSPEEIQGKPVRQRTWWTPLFNGS